jgi:hypothetical protein
MMSHTTAQEIMYIKQIGSHMITQMPYSRLEMLERYRDAFKLRSRFGRYELEMVDCNVPLMGGFHS